MDILVIYLTRVSISLLVLRIGKIASVESSSTRMGLDSLFCSQSTFNGEKDN